MQVSREVSFVFKLIASQFYFPTYNFYQSLYFNDRGFAGHTGSDPNTKDLQNRILN